MKDGKLTKQLWIHHTPTKPLVITNKNVGIHPDDPVVAFKVAILDSF